MEIKEELINNENNKCPVCESVKYSQFETFGNFVMLKCQSCDLVYSFPMRSMTNQEYAQKYAESGYHEGFATALSTGQDFFLKKNSLNNKKKTILDIGTSTGLFVYVAKKRAFNKVIGIETDKEAVAYGRKLFSDVTIFEGDLSLFVSDNEKDEKFDYVTLFEVLEHVENPKMILEKAKNILKNKGKLVVFVPNRNRTPKLYQEMIDRGVDMPPHHLTKWSKKALYNIFTSLELKNIKIYDIGKYRFPLLPSFGIASKIRTKIAPSQNFSNTINDKENYRDNLRKIFKTLARSRFIIDSLLFFWLDIFFYFKGYERDGLYIEGEL